MNDFTEFAARFISFVIAAALILSFASAIGSVVALGIQVIQGAESND